MIKLHNFQPLLAMRCIIVAAVAGSPAGWALHFVNTNVIACELKSGNQPYNTRGFKFPYFWMVKVSDIFHVKEVHSNITCALCIFSC
jgi:hypothetical protein